jgi:flavin reductase (DIM6/NTAB) family NADH-FMN oxidoreductase RutF
MAGETPEQRMTNALRMHAAGVALVTTETPEGPVGLTISSLSSVSVRPRVLMFSFTHRNGAAGAILDADRFVVHLLRAANAGIARNFGGPHGVRSAQDQHWARLPSGEPYLPSAAYAIRCTHRDRLTVGESRIIVADVVRVRRCTPGPPLVYCDRDFHTLTALEETRID